MKKLFFIFFISQFFVIITSQGETTTKKTRKPLTIHTTQTYKPSDPGYVPCESYIAISADNTQQLNNDNFQTELNFISSIYGGMNHPERLMYSYGWLTPVMFNARKSIQEIQSLVLSTKLLSNQIYSLETTLKTLYGTMMFNFNSTISTNVLVFISDTTDPINYQNADKYANILNSLNVRITLVLMGNKVDKNKLTSITNNFIIWSDLTKPQPDNWDTLFPPAFGCNSGISTLSPTTAGASTTTSTTTTTTSPIATNTSYSTTTTTVAATTTTTAATTTTTAATTTTTNSATTTTTSLPTTTTKTGSITTPTPAYICESHIPIGVDVSMTLTSDEFTFMKNFILNPFISDVYPDDISPAAVVTFSELANAYKPAANKNKLISFVQSIVKQGNNQEGFVSQALVSLESYISFTDSSPVNTVIFTGSELDKSQIPDLQAKVDMFKNKSKVIIIFMSNKIDISTTNYNKVQGLSLVGYNSDPLYLISNLEKAMNCSSSL